jgi:hypothetical protein
VGGPKVTFRDNPAFLGFGVPALPQPTQRRRTPISLRPRNPIARIRKKACGNLLQMISASEESPPTRHSKAQCWRPREFVELTLSREHPINRLKRRFEPLPGF